MMGSLTTGMLQCMDTGPSGKIGWEGRSSVKHSIRQAHKCPLTINFLGFLQTYFGPSCD